MNDLKFALRQTMKNPGFTPLVVLTLALGISVNTSMFSALQALLVLPLPYHEAGESGACVPDFAPVTARTASLGAELPGFPPVALRNE